MYVCIRLQTIRAMSSKHCMYVCMYAGEPDYDNLFVYRNQPIESNRPGPEPPDLWQYDEKEGEGYVCMPIQVNVSHV